MGKLKRKVEENPKYQHPQEIDQVTYAFPSGIIGKLLPEAHEIPEEFDMYTSKNPLVKLAGGFFFGSYKEVWYASNEGIDKDLAIRHLQTVLRSYQPKHEHKVAGAAYLIDLWFDAIATSDGENVTIWASEGTEDMTRKEFFDRYINNNDEAASEG